MGRTGQGKRDEGTKILQSLSSSLPPDPMGLTAAGGCELTDGAPLPPQGGRGDLRGRQQRGVLWTGLGGHALFQLGWVFQNHLFSAWVLPSNQKTRCSLRALHPMTSHDQALSSHGGERSNCRPATWQTRKAQVR